MPCKTGCSDVSQDSTGAPFAGDFSNDSAAGLIWDNVLMLVLCKRNNSTMRPNNFSLSSSGGEGRGRGGLCKHLSVTAHWRFSHLSKLFSRFLAATNSCRYLPCNNSPGSGFFRHSRKPFALPRPTMLQSL